MPADVWKDRDVAAAFLNERSLLIPDRQRQLEVLLRVLRSAERPFGCACSISAPATRFCCARCWRHFRTRRAWPWIFRH